MTHEAFVQKYLLFLVLNNEHPDIHENYMDPVFFTPITENLQRCLESRDTRDRFYNAVMALYPDQPGGSAQEERCRERQISQAISEASSDSDAGDLFTNLKNLVRAKLQVRRYEGIRLSDEELNYALDPSITETLLVCNDTEKTANAFIAFLCLRNEYPQLTFDCFPFVGLLLADNIDQYINDANARRLLFEQQIKYNQTIMYMGGYNHEWVHHQKLNLFKLLMVNDRCRYFNQEFMLNQELFEILIDTLDDDLNSITPVELADQVECFVRLRNTRLPDDDELIEPHRFNEIRQLLPNYIGSLRSRNNQMITFAYLEIKREFQARNQDEAERAAGLEEGRMNSLMAAYERSPDQSLVPDSIIQQEVAPSPEDLIRDRLIQEFQPYLQAYDFEEVHRERLLHLAGCLPSGHDNMYKIKYIIAFLLIQRLNSDLTDDDYVQLNRENVFRRLVRQVPLQDNRKLMAEIHFQRPLNREELQQCATVLLNYLNQPEAQPVQLPRESLMEEQHLPLTEVEDATPNVHIAVSGEQETAERTRRQVEERNYLKQELQDKRISNIRQLRHQEAIIIQEGQRNGDRAVGQIIANIDYDIIASDRAYNVLVNTENNNQPFIEQCENGRIEKRNVAGIQGTNNNCGLAATMMALNSQGLLHRMIEMAEQNENVSEELLDVLRNLLLNSENDFIHDRHLARLRQILDFRVGVTLEMPDIIGRLLTGLGFQTWGNTNEMTDYRGPAAIQFIPLFTINPEERPIEDVIQETYRNNLDAHPRNEGETQEQRDIRIEQAVLTIPVENKPEMLFVTYPRFGAELRLTKTINNEIVMLDDNCVETAYSLVSMISIEQSHYVSWNIDQDNNRLTFADSMSYMVHRTTIPSTVAVQGILNGADVRQPLFSEQGEDFIKGIKQRRERAMQRLRQAHQNEITLAPDEQEQLLADSREGYINMIDFFDKLKSDSVAFIFKRKDL
ncbi:MAG: hypothetical protein B0D91_03235 [Oceanospirillales bacterium LUC14_002_19_P2]|nr:MAG: hypothetical protein B0D91_03235 [Oceanospirillales bacterium LUC14_002_19_P2]